MSGKRILIILGGIYHDFEGFASAVKPILERAGHTVQTTYDLDALTRLDDAGYDLVMSYTSLSSRREGQGDTHPETLSSSQTDSLIRWVGGGGAFLSVHCATVSSASNPKLKAFLGGVFLNHPPAFTFTVYPSAREHPIIAGISAFCVEDEFYIQAYAPSLDVHMVAIDRGIAYPMVWSRREGKGRVANITMGHSEKVWGLDAYQRLMLQAVDWLTGTTEEGDES
jgi:type 1 glutamine amidotransferase